MSQTTGVAKHIMPNILRAFAWMRPLIREKAKNRTNPKGLFAGRHSDCSPISVTRSHKENPNRTANHQSPLRDATFALQHTEQVEQLSPSFDIECLAAIII
jgi:hypothetical protein